MKLSLKELLSKLLNWSGLEFTWDANTNNTTDTWILVTKDYRTIQHRVLPRKLVHAQLVTANIDKAFGHSVNVTAPAVSGYTFLCWAEVATVGWVGSVYPSAPLSNPCDMWNAQAGQSGTGRIDCLALYIPTN